MLSRREHAFTMIELIVSMALLMIVVGGVIFAVTQLGDGSSSLAANRKAQRDALDAMEQVRHDVAAARSPALEAFTGRRETMRDLMYFGNDNIAVDPRDRSRNLCNRAQGPAYVRCMQGIVLADANSLWFRASVNNVSNAVAECIGYEVETAGQNTALVRYQSNDWLGCDRGARTSMNKTVLIQGRGQLRTTRGGGMFRYTLRYQPGLRPTEIADPAGCRTFVAQAPRGSELRFISAVDIDLSGFAADRDQGAVAGLTTSSAVSAHVAGDYAFATGCAP